MFNVSPVSFHGKYQIDANQKMPNNEACLRRDTAVGFWINFAENGKEVKDEFVDFIAGEFNEGEHKSCPLTLELDDKYDHDFEETMNAVGQKFDKLA